MTEAQLKVEEVYFLVTYADPQLRKPVVITYEYVGSGTSDEDGQQVFMFRYLPAFWYSDEPDGSRVDDGPILLPAAQLIDIVDLEGLIERLQRIKGRATK